MTPKRCRIIEWGGPLPEVGHYLQTSSGSLYVIIAMRENTRPNHKSVASAHLLRLDGDEERETVPSDALIHPFRWNSR